MGVTGPGSTPPSYPLSCAPLVRPISPRNVLPMMERIVTMYSTSANIASVNPVRPRFAMG